MDQPPINTSEEISLRDLALRLRNWTLEVIRYWYIPGVLVLLGIGIQVFRYIQYVPLYTATITFNVDEDEGGNSQGLASILGQFGLGSVRPTRYNLDKILALSKSRRVIQESLFSKSTVNGKEDFLANHLLREYKLNIPRGKDKLSSPPFYFTQDSIPAFSLQENAMLLLLYGTIVGPPDHPKKALVISDYNEDSNIMSLSATTTNETISLDLTKYLFESLSKYYVSKSIEKLQKTYKLIIMKRDSVLEVLKSTEFQLASFKDTHKSLLMRTDQITELRLQRELAALTAMYGEVLKNVEIADFSLKNKTPFIQIIDSPIAPIPPIELSLLRQLFIGIIVGGILGSLVVLGRMFYRNTFL